MVNRVFQSRQLFPTLPFLWLLILRFVICNPLYPSPLSMHHGIIFPILIPLLLLSQPLVNIFFTHEPYQHLLPQILVLIGLIILLIPMIHILLSIHLLIQFLHGMCIDQIMVLNYFTFLLLFQMCMLIATFSSHLLFGLGTLKIKPTSWSISHHSLPKLLCVTYFHSTTRLFHIVRLLCFCSSFIHSPQWTYHGNVVWQPYYRHQVQMSLSL